MGIDYSKILKTLMYLLYPIIIILSWIMNIGWLRIIFLIPMIIHAVLFQFSNLNFHRYHQTTSKNMKKINKLGYCTFILFHILLPDGGDTDDSFRVFFGLNKNERLIDIAGSSSEVFLLMNLIIITLQLIYIKKIKRKNEDRKSRKSLIKD